ncbi:MAG: response regulator [Candidatus Moraniibacteriota bacterium]
MLIVEDDAQSASAAIDYLSDKYECYLAKDYCEALELLEKRRYDYVVTDTLYPQATGTGLKDRIEELAQEVKTTLEEIYGSYENISHRSRKGLEEWVNNPDEATQPMGVFLIRTLFELKYSRAQIILTTSNHHGELFEPVWCCICNKRTLPSFPWFASWPALSEGNKHQNLVWKTAHEILQERR